jgi:hypothetical protein
MVASLTIRAGSLLEVQDLVDPALDEARAVGAGVASSMGKILAPLKISARR